MMNLVILTTTTMMAMMLLMISGGDVMLSMPVTIDGIERELTMQKGQSAEMAALSFAQSQGFVDALDEAKLGQIVSELSNLLSRRLEAVADQGPQQLFEIDITVDTQLTKLRAFAGQTINQVLEGYFTTYGITGELRDNLLPQVKPVLDARVAQFVKDNRAVVFTLPIVIGRETLDFEHREGLDVTEEARAWVLENITPEYQQMVFPEVLKLISEEVRALENGQISTTERPSVIFRVPIMINEQQYTVLAYEGYSIRDSAIQFLRDQGVTDEATAASYLPALIQVIEQNALKGSTTTQSEEETPLLSIPLLMNQEQVKLEHFQSQSPEYSAQQFALKHGLENEPGFDATIAQLSTLIRDQLAKTESKPVEEPMFAVPITLNNTLYEMNFYPQDKPETAARGFCLEHQALIVTADPANQTMVYAQLNECTSFLAETVISILNRLAQEQELAKANEQEPTLLFNLDVNIGNDQVATIGFYAGNDPERVAQNFCAQTGVSTDNLPAIVQAIREQIANL